MRFQVPQFIDVEDKIFGPLTFKQFIYVAGGAGICFVLIALLPNFIAFILCIPVAAFSLALAFYKINSKPFIHIVEAFVGYTLGSKLYIWKKEEKKPIAQKREPVHTTMYVPKLSQSKLKDLSLALDIQKNQAENLEDTL